MNTFPNEQPIYKIAVSARMSNMDGKYPEHIYDPIRFEVASSIVSHELKKIFSGLTQDEYRSLEKQIFDWPLNPQKYSLTKEPRDFWNGVEGIMTGFRLKGVVRFLTAQNVTWTKEEIDPLQCTFSTDHFFVSDTKVPTLNNSAVNVMEWLNSNNYVAGAIKKVEESYDKGIPRVLDPIYCKRNEDGGYLALDGNGRVLYALLKKLPTLIAYVGEMRDEKPNNYWVYTMFLINLSSSHKKEFITTEEYKKMLKGIFSESESALVEYKERVPDTDDLKKIILE